MAEFQLISLNDEDLECVSKIINSGKGGSTPQAAIKWALKQCSTDLKETQPFTIVWDELETKPVGKPPTTDDRPAKIRIPVGKHKVAMVTFPMKNLVEMEHNVVVDLGTLKHLEPDLTTESALLFGAKGGKIVF